MPLHNYFKTNRYACSKSKGEVNEVHGLILKSTDLQVYEQGEGRKTQID